MSQRIFLTSTAGHQWCRRLLTPTAAAVAAAGLVHYESSESKSVEGSVTVVGSSLTRRVDSLLWSTKTLCEPQPFVPPASDGKPDVPSSSFTLADSITETASTTTTVEEEEDPYDNLPDEDEPTTCIVCLANRQGPCRPLWRKMEHCFKDYPIQSNESDNRATDSAVDNSRSDVYACEKYLLPWMQCTHQYRNLYLMYLNKVYQDTFITPLEEALRSNERERFPSTPTVDWVPLTKYYEEHWEEVLARELPKSADDDVVLIEATGDSFEDQPEWINPELVHLTIAIPMVDQRSGMTVEVAYVKDQSGLLLGSDTFFKQRDDSETNVEEPADADNGTLKFSIRPEKTHCLQIFALYKEGDKAVLYASYPVYPLLEAMPSRKSRYSPEN